MPRGSAGQLAFLASLLILASMSAVGAAGTAAAPSAAPADLPAALAMLESLAADTVSFWGQHGPDWDQGGFHTALDRAGKPLFGDDVGGGDKFIVPAARQLYSFATLAQKAGSLLNSSISVGREKALELAEHAYRFLTGSAMWDEQARQFNWQVSRSGSRVVQPEKVLYGQAFAILALARYARAANARAAADWAWRVFESVDATRHDAERGGYLEGEELRYPRGVGIGTSPGAERSQNTHLHLMEALTELSAALGAAGGLAERQALVDARLGELVGLVASRLYQPGTGHLGMEFRGDWTVLDPGAEQYGHELENLYFVMAAARQMRAGGSLAPAQEAAVAAAERAALAAARAAAAEGYDERRGGLWTDGRDGKPWWPDKCGQNDTLKTWWAQFEAICGFFWLWRSTGEPAYWERLAATLDALQGTFHDPAGGGEFFAFVADGSGEPVCEGSKKAYKWKTAYHSLRGLLYAREWLAAVRDGVGPVPQV